MKQLIQWIQDYKKNPTPALKDEILDRLLLLEENGELGALVHRGEWCRMEKGIRLRRRDTGIYDVAEMYQLPTGNCMCYFYSIDLRNYSYGNLEELKNNCLEALETAPDGGFFSAYAVALAHDADQVENVFMAGSSAEAEKWFEAL